MIKIGHDGLLIIPECKVCGLRKSPWARDVAPCAAAGYCDRDCEGYNSEPYPSSYWSVNEPKLGE